MINGDTKLIAHIGYPTHSFKAPMIYNPWFKQQNINAVVVPMSCKAEDYADFLKNLFKLTNIIGCLITMPHKVATIKLVDRLSERAKIAGSVNAIRLGQDGKLEADIFDGEGFVRGLKTKGQQCDGASVFMAGCGGVGSAIAASLALAKIAEISLYDPYILSQNSLAARLKLAYPQLKIKTGVNDPQNYDIVVNATPLGMNDTDPLPMDISRIKNNSFVGEVVMKKQITPFLTAVIERGCNYQMGTDMLFEQIPAYLEFFGLGSATANALRAVSQIHYG